MILVHGFGEDGEIWNNQLESLKNKYQLIIPDLPGSGESEMIVDMSIEGMAEVIHEIIQEENIESCPVIGHSMGGYISLALADKYWNQVSALGLFHSSSFSDSEEKKSARRKGIEFIETNGGYEFLKTVIPNLFSGETKDKNPGLADEWVDRGRNFSGPSLVSYYQAMIDRPDRTGVLTKSTVPLLFIMGKEDKAVPPEDSLKQCHLPEKSYIHMLYRSAHMGMLEEPEKTNFVLDEFLSDV